MKYSVIVNFSNNDTVVALNKGNYSMCCFLACNPGSSKGGYPLCWNVTTQFLASVRVLWYDELIAYCSSSTLKDNSSIFVPQPLCDVKNFACNESAVSRMIAVKERMIIGPYGSTTVKTNPNCNVGIVNNSSTPCVAGLGIKGSSGFYSGICGFNLYRNSPLGLKPVNSILLAIGMVTAITQNMAVGSLAQSGILIDVSKSSTQSQSMSYDINTGWSPVDVSWVVPYAANDDLGAILLQK
jgi:hypothetical protein